MKGLAKLYRLAIPQQMTRPEYPFDRRRAWTKGRPEGVRP